MTGFTVWNLDITTGVISLGVFTGLTYGLLAAGLVLVYRSSRFINFAHGAIGVFGAAVCSLAVRDFELPYWIAFALGLFVAAGFGALTEIAVVKPLSSSPKVLSMVATLGVGSFLVFTSLAINPDGMSGLNFPKPAGMPTGNIDALTVTPAYAAQAILSPLLLAALGLFLWKSRTGLAIRVAASNTSAASTSGIPSRSVSVLTWAIAGAVAAFSVTLIIPTKGVVTPETLGPELLVRGLAAAAIARFTNFGLAIGVATAIGVVEQVLATNPDANGAIEVVILLGVVVALLTTARSPRAVIEPWTNRSLPRVIPDAYKKLPIVSVAPKVVTVLALVGAAIVPFRASGSQALDLTVVIAMAIVGLSVVVVTGLGGQLTLAQFAYGAIGAAVAIQASEDLGFIGGLVVGSIIAALASVILGLAALRVQGLALGVASLIFAIVTTSWLLDRGALLGDAPAPVRPSLTIAEIRTDQSRGYYWIALAALAVAMAFVARLRSSAWARTLVAVRDNSDAAKAMSVSARSMRLQAAAVGGLLAGLGGAIYGSAFSNLSSSNFPVQLSIDAVTATVIGGLSSLSGPIIGAFYLLGLPALFSPTPEAATALAGAWIALIVSEPAGISGVVDRVTTVVHDRSARAAGIDVAAARSGAVTRDSVNIEFGAERCAATEQPLILDVQGVSKRYGGLIAVDDVSFSVAPRQIVGLIGPNGAGKTTLFEMISGFVTPGRGKVIFRGVDVTATSPEARARAGMARSFQSATLFPTLTLTEAVMVASERVSPSSLFEAFGPATKDNVRRERARALLAQFELGGDAESLVGALPTGTRRIAELACAVAARPTLILLDEPSAGVAHSESERLATVLRAIRDELGITLVLIEHDLPLLFEVCDSMVALATGSKIAEGIPADVRSHPQVVESYVG